MNPTPQEQLMLQALRDSALPPLYVLNRIRIDSLNDPNVDETRRNEIVGKLETYISQLWEDYHGENSPKGKEA